MDRSRLFTFSLFSGIFTLMALSNAIIPILPDLRVPIDMQAFIFSAYFFGAMVTTLPGGIISDRIGQMPVILTALLLTLIGGFALVVISDPIIMLMFRVAEGVGAGLFVSAGLSWINYQTDHIRLSGAFMALLNVGLLSGLLAGGWIAGNSGVMAGGILLFSCLTLVPAITVSLLMIRGTRIETGKEKNRNGASDRLTPGDLLREVSGMSVRQAPLWFSVIVLLGITGFVQAIYPDISEQSAPEIGAALALMNLATVIASLLASRIKIEPVMLIRISALVIGALVLVFLQFPLSVAVMGFVAGLIMISQISYLAIAEEHQGIAMGLFSTASYAGMTILPALGGYIISVLSLETATFTTSILAVISAVFIGWCRCRGFRIPT